MDKNEAERLVAVLQWRAPYIQAKAELNIITRAYEVAINGGDPRGVRVWLKTPIQALRYIAGLTSSNRS